MKIQISNQKKKILLILLLLICFSLFLLTFMERDSDYYWHIKAGEYMFQNGIIKKDVFSWVVMGKTWICHEWLFELFIYSLSIPFPKTHLIIYGFASIISLFSILFLSNKKEYLKNIPFTLIWISFSIIFMPYIQGRPNLISFNLLALTIKLLFDNYQKEDSKQIYFLPVISVLWANFHGGSSNLVYLFCLLFYFCSLIEIKTSRLVSSRKSKKQRKKYLLVFFISIFTTIINIHGFKMILYPYQNMLDSTMLNAIEEWSPINLTNINHYPYIVLALFIFFTFIFSKKKIELIDLLLYLLSIFLSFKSIRFSCYTYIIMSFIIFQYINPRKEDKGTTLILTSLCITFLSIFLFNYKNILYNSNKLNISEEIIHTIKKEKPKRLFNDYNIGGELIYRNINVFIDGRADLYSPTVLSNYLTITNTTKNYQSLIQKYDFDYYLVNKKSNINKYLKNQDTIQLMIKDSNYILYKKN